MHDHHSGLNYHCSLLVQILWSRKSRSFQKTSSRTITRGLCTGTYCNLQILEKRKRKTDRSTQEIKREEPKQTETEPLIEKPIEVESTPLNESSESAETHHSRESSSGII